MFALAHAREIGLPTQINPTVTRHNVSRLDEITQLVYQSGARLCSVFFPVATGRASASQDLTAEAARDRALDRVGRRAAGGRSLGGNGADEAAV